MRLSWFGEFFGAMPETFRALYDFGDPQGVGNGWWGFVILAIWGILFFAIPVALAKRWYGTHEWASATMGCVAGFTALWWVYGILPSAWLNFLDSNIELLQGPVIPASLRITIGDTTLDIASNLYQVIRDTVVVVEHLVAFVATFWAAAKIQEQYPKTLMPGETKPEAGGYK